jgi:uncharacterized protein YndB with AHSA1/START domain
VTGTPAGAVTLRRTFAIPREAVFEAWTDPQALMTWFGGQIARTLDAAIDLRPGGAFRLTMQSGEEIGAVEGTYVVVEPPQRLVFTWRWDRRDVEGGRESLVTVEFRDRDGATEVVIKHEGIETGDSWAFHMRGWTASLDQLEHVATRSSEWTAHRSSGT